MRRRRRHSRPLLPIPATTIIQPTPVETMRLAAICGSVISGRFLRGSALRNLPRVGVCLEVQLPAAPIGYVRVELRRREVRVSEHLLDAPQVGTTFEQVCGERVAQEVG